MARVTPNIVVRTVDKCGEGRGGQVQGVREWRSWRRDVAWKMGHRRGGGAIRLGHRGNRGAIGKCHRGSWRRRVRICRRVRGQGWGMGHGSRGTI